MTQNLPSDNSYEVLYKEALKLYEGLKTKSKKTESGFQVSNSKSSDNEKKEAEDNKESEEDIVDQEIEEKGVKININLNGEGK